MKPLLRRPSFWVLLAVALGSQALTPLFRPTQPTLQSHALALLLSGTVALSGYLFVVIIRPESFD